MQYRKRSVKYSTSAGRALLYLLTRPAYHPGLRFLAYLTPLVKKYAGHPFTCCLNNSLVYGKYLVITDRTPVLFFGFPVSNPAEYG
jgi:hypothetical protein